MINILKLFNQQKKIFIAFDGVAPAAKLNQQRKRRHKSFFEKQFSVNEEKWDKIAITPGTNFMNKLNSTIKNYYIDNDKVIISGSDEIGEGEHKIFQYIRDHKITSSVIYGLDADLIMLGLNHLYNNEIFLFRETPEFIKSINSSLEPNMNYFLDLPLLSIELKKYMKFKCKSDHLQDYIFLCFFLGNDFLPHFPSLNIRTHGIDFLLNAYYITNSKKKTKLIENSMINWKNVKKLIKYLAEQEFENLTKEYKMRAKWDKRSTNEISKIPMYNRSLEKYINPYEINWEKRYYNSLFDCKNIDYICKNYLEGLEWVFHYYNSGCIDWKWMYDFNYPPLLKDLVLFVPDMDIKILKTKQNTAVHPYVQLSYVLPQQCLGLLPTNLYIKLIKHKSNCYTNHFNFCWAFCKYFWESHIILPKINLNELETFVEFNLNGTKHIPQYSQN